MSDDAEESVDLDLAAFRVRPPALAVGRASVRSTNTRRQHFINRIPMVWAIHAASVTVPAAAVLLAIRYFNGFKPGEPFETTLSRLTLGLISLDTARRSLHRLEHQGLIKVDRRPGRKLRITVIEA